MKNNIIFILFTIIALNANSQELTFSNVPDTWVKGLPDAWYKYEAIGACFDVQITKNYITKGKIKWYNGDRYSGNLSKSKFSGKGTYIWNNKERYEGNFKNNKPHGKGSFYYKNGDKYYGKWKYGKQQGKGTLYKKDDTIIVGIWHEGELWEEKE